MQLSCSLNIDIGGYAEVWLICVIPRPPTIIPTCRVYTITLKPSHYGHSRYQGLLSEKIN